jgi:hypothetical protein
MAAIIAEASALMNRDASDLDASCARIPTRLPPSEFRRIVIGEVVRSYLRWRSSSVSHSDPHRAW